MKFLMSVLMLSASLSSVSAFAENSTYMNTNDDQASVMETDIWIPAGQCIPIYLNDCNL